MPGLLIHGARQVLTLRGASSPRRGTALRNLAIIEDGSILIEDGKIRDVGPTRRIENLAAARSARQISARGRVVMPGFADSHLQLFSGPDPEMQLRTIRQTPAWRLEAGASALLKRCLRYGTTAIEVKSCGGLDDVAALKVLRIVAGLAKSQPIELISTFCGAIGAPSTFDDGPESHTAHLIGDLLPLIKEKKLAEFVAVPGGRPAKEAWCAAVRAAAKRLGLPIKVHGDGPAPVESMLGDEASVEYLEWIVPVEALKLAELPAVAVLMPGFGFHCVERGYAPARELIEAGVAVALASGYDRALNPSFSMPITIELACRGLGMAPSEAIVAATLNGAYAMGRGARTGSIEPGKDADILILETSDYKDLAYETGVNPVDMTIVRGEVVCRNSVSYAVATAV